MTLSPGLDRTLVGVMAARCARTATRRSGRKSSVRHGVERVIRTTTLTDPRPIPAEAPEAAPRGSPRPPASRWRSPHRPPTIDPRPRRPSSSGPLIPPDAPHVGGALRRGRARRTPRAGKMALVAFTVPAGQVVLGWPDDIVDRARDQAHGLRQTDCRQPTRPGHRLARLLVRRTAAGPHPRLPGGRRERVRRGRAPTRTVPVVAPGHRHPDHHLTR
jgi:hypothetical protein